MKNTFNIVIDSQTIIVRYQLNYPLTEMAHFEFLSPYSPARRIPISDTGYRSYYTSMEDVKASPTLEDFALIVVKSHMNSKVFDATEKEDEQMMLF